MRTLILPNGRDSLLLTLSLYFRIKSRATETVLLVADTACDEYHNERGIVITGSLASVIRTTSSEDDIDSREEHNIHEEEDEVIDTRMQRPSVTSTGMSKFVKVLPDQPVTERVMRSEEKTRGDTGSLGRQDSGVSEGTRRSSTVRGTPRTWWTLASTSASRRSRRGSGGRGSMTPGRFQ